MAGFAGEVEFPKQALFHLLYQVWQIVDLPPFRALMQLSGNAFQDIEIGFDYRSNLGALDLHCHHLPCISKNSFVNLG